MSWSDIARGVAGGLGGYEAVQGRPVPPQQQQQNSGGGANGGLLMKYLDRQRANQQKGRVMGQAQAPTPMPSPMSNTLSAPPMQPDAQMGDSQPVTPPQNQQYQPLGGAAPLPLAYRQGRPMAQGQVVTKPTTALLGEDGPEMVVPLNGRPDAKVSTGNLGMNYARRGC